MQKGVSVFFVWIVIFYLACKVHGQANTGSLVFETIGDNKGLSNNNVNSILQDSKGFIWIGTRYGLNCYDGITCRTFFNEEGSRESIPDNHINQMAEDHAGNLWIGTGMGISCLNLSTRRFINFLHTDADRNELKNLNFNVFADKSGTIWASNGYFLLRYEKNSNHFKKFPLDGGQSTGLVRNYFVLDFLQDSKNRIWLATSYGVKLLNPETGQTQSFHFPETIARLKENAITAIEEAPDGTIFAGTWGGGLLQWNEELRKFELFDSQLSLGKNWNKIVFDIKFFKGQIYLGTNDGLLTTSYLNSKSLNHSTTWRKYATEKENPRSLSGNIVQKISIDREENIWLATNDNLT